MADRYLYLTRHAEPADDGRLTERGRRQAALLADRLRDGPVEAVHHGPLPRVRETAALVGERLGLAPQQLECAGDYLPHLPARAELPPDSADMLLEFVAGSPAEPELAAEALRRFTGPVDDAEPRHELVVTHGFLLGWLVRDALDAPPWRWLGLNHAHAALTVIRYAAGRPAYLLAYNDMAHLPDDLRWTGFPPQLRF